MHPGLSRGKAVITELLLKIMISFTLKSFWSSYLALLGMERGLRNSDLQRFIWK